MSEIINSKNKIDDILKNKIKEFQLKNIAMYWPQKVGQINLTY